MAIAFTQLSSSAVTPALANVCLAFPEVPTIFISMLSTLPSLLSAPFTLMSGFLAGQKTKYRTLELVGILFMLISGVAPFFFNNFYIILFWRSLFGIGTGLAIPLLMPLTLKLFSYNVQGQMGNNSIAINVGAIIFQLIGGLLCTQFGWKSTFLIYFLLLAIFIVVAVYLPEPQIIYEKVAQKNKRENFFDIAKAIKWYIINFFYMIFFYALVTQTSDVIRENAFGSAATAGIVLAIFTVGGVFGGFIFRFSKFILNKIFIIVFTLMATGFLIMALSSNVIVLTLGEFVAGIGFGLFNPAAAIAVGFSVSDQARTKASSLLLIFGNLGGFLSAFALSAIGNMLGFSGGRFSFWASFAFFAFASLICPIIKSKGISVTKAE